MLRDQEMRSRGVRVPVLVAVAQPGLLSRVGGKRDDRPREKGTRECGASAADSGNDPLGVGEPVGRSEPERAREVREDVHDHDDTPDAEADRVHAKQ